MVQNALLNTRAIVKILHYGNLCVTARRTAFSVVNKHVSCVFSQCNSIASETNAVVRPKVTSSLLVDSVKSQQPKQAKLCPPADSRHLSTDMAEANTISVEPVTSDEGSVNVNMVNMAKQQIIDDDHQDQDMLKLDNKPDADINMEDASRAQKRKWFGSKSKTKKGKKLDRHPKKIEKFANDQKFNETTYYFDNGLRKVTPYVYVFEAHVKGRWMKRSVLDVFREEFRSETPEYYKKAINAGLITIDGKKVSLDKILHNNEFLRSMVHRHEPPVTGQPLDILTVNEEFVVINKPASIPVHPCGKYRHNTIIFLLGKEFGLTGLHTIHRLDRLTSGLLMFARTREVSQRVDAYVRERKLTKTYVCKVTGEFPCDAIDCMQPILTVSHKIGVCRVSPDGKVCKTLFKRLSYDGHTSIVQCFPHTGRMHQIRVHLQYLGYPIVNDPLYNNPVWGPQIGKGGDIPHRTEQELLNELIKQHSAELQEQVIQDPDDFVKSTRIRLVTDNPQTMEGSASHGKPEALLADEQCGSATHNDAGGMEVRTDYSQQTAAHSDENTTPVSVSTLDVNIEGSIGKQTDETMPPPRSNLSVDEPNQIGLTEPQASDDLTCQPSGTSANDEGTERPLESEIDMKEDERRQLVQDMCRECKLKLRDPRPEEMTMYLHALSYKGPGFDFSTPLPTWAEEHIQRSTAKSAPTNSHPASSKSSSNI